MGMFGNSSPTPPPPGWTPPGIGARILNQIGAELTGFDYLGQKRRDAVLNAQLQAQGNFNDALKNALTPQYADGQGPQINPPTVSYAPPTTGDVGNVSLPTPQTQSNSSFNYTPPQQTSPGLTIDDPRLPGIVAAARSPFVNYDIKPLIDVLTAQQPKYEAGRPGTQLYNAKTGQFGARISNPQYVNDQLVDPTSPNAPTFVPKYPQLTMPDGKGGVIPLPGATQATQAISQADQTGKTFGSVVEKTQPNGQVSQDLGVNLYGPSAGAPGGGSAAAPGNQGPGVKPSPQDQAYRTAQASAAAERYKAYQDAGAAAPGAIARLSAMNNLLKGYEGGSFAPELYDISSGLNSLGIKVDPRLANKDAAQVLQRTMATEAMKNPDTGANMFPRVTNFEYENALKQVPGLMQSAQGRQTVIAMKTAEQNRIADIAGRARQWNQRFGRIDTPDASGRTFQDYLDAWSTKHPLYSGIKGLSSQ